MTEQKIWQKPWVVSLLATFCCVLWGSAFPCIKIGYSLFHIEADAIGSQILFAGLRFALAGVMVIIVTSIGNRGLLLPTAASIPSVLKLSLFQTIIQYLFFYMGLAHASGVKSAIITGTNSLLSILIASLIFRQEKLTPVKITGCALGLLGVVLANLGGGATDLSMKWNGEGFIFISAVSYALSSVLIKRYSARHNPVMMSGWQFTLGGMALAAAGLWMGGTMGAVSLPALAILLYLAFVSAAAYTVWGVLLKYNPVSRVTIFGFMNPVVGVLLSALLLGEGGQAFSVRNLLALILVCAGICVVNRFQKQESMI